MRAGHWAAGGIGTPDQLRAHLAAFEEAGVDQVIFIQQGGRNRHEHICESLELFAGDVMPEFKRARGRARASGRPSELAPYVEAALARKQRMTPLADADIPTYPAYGRMITDPGGPAAAK